MADSMMRHTILLLAVIGTSFGLASAVLHPTLRVVYNASASAPKGFYLIEPPTTFAVGDYLVVQLPRDVRRFAAMRGYVPESVPVLKRIAARAGDEVCAHDRVLYVNGRPTVRALSVDGMSRPLTSWRECRRMVSSELFLLNEASASFDSRYFGPLDASYVRGRATPLALLDPQ